MNHQREISETKIEYTPGTPCRAQFQPSHTLAEVDSPSPGRLEDKPTRGAASRSYHSQDQLESPDDGRSEQIVSDCRHWVYSSLRAHQTAALPRETSLEIPACQRVL